MTTPTSDDQSRVLNQNTSKKNALIARSFLTITSVSLLALPFISQISFAQTPSSSEGLGSPPIPRLIMIQGQVKAIQGAIATVHIPAYTPPCQVPACTAVRVPAKDVQVDTTNAIFQGADGQTFPRKLSSGEKVVITGAVPTMSEGTPTLQALPAVIIERAVKFER